VVTRLIRAQLVIFAVLTMIALIALGWYYCACQYGGIGRYTPQRISPRPAGCTGRRM